MNASLLFCLALILPAGAIRFVNGSDLFEGDPCKMEDGTEGECVRIPKCPMRIQEVQKGSRDAISTGRCSFDGFMEIVCCPKEKILQPPVVPLSITEKPLVTEPNPTIKSTEGAEINLETETSTIIDRLPESMITINFTMPDFTTIASEISEADNIISEISPVAKITSEGSILTEEITKASMNKNDEAYVETSSPLTEKTTENFNLITDASSPLVEILSTSTATSKITEMMTISSTAEATKISDDRFGARPAEIAVNQTAEATLGTNAPFSEKMTTIDTNSAVETSPLIEMLTSTIANGITETLVTKSTTEITNITGDAIDVPAETEKYQTAAPQEESNNALQKTTVESLTFERTSPLLEILTSTLANKITAAPMTGSTTQPLDISDNGVRPAEAACNDYKKGFLDRDGKTIFLIPILIGEPILKSGEFPFMGALGYKMNKDNSKLIKYKCGGTLITTQHILTAAHCVSNADNNVPVEVRLGHVNPNEISASVQIIPVGEITVHPNYKIGLNYHNIAIIKLSTAAVISRQVMPICLQYIFIPNLTFSINMSRIITGWGLAREDSNDLPEISRLRLIEETKCNDFYKNYKELAQGVDESTICLQDENVMRSADACQGNASGVPLVQVNRDSINVIGIELLSQNCKSNLPAVYVNTFSYLDWIEKVVWPDMNVPAVPLIDPEFDVRNGFKD